MRCRYIGKRILVFLTYYATYNAISIGRNEISFKSKSRSKTIRTRSKRSRSRSKRIRISSMRRSSRSKRS